MKILNRSEIAQQFNMPATDSTAPHYNVKIKSIIKDDKIYDESNHYSLKPQEIALIITDRVALTNAQIGFLHTKQKNYRKGLWVVEPDIVHPGYKGHLRIHVVNMSTLNITLKANDDILELIIFSNKNNFGDFPYKEKNYDEIIRISLEEEQRTPETFLNIKANEKEIQSIIFPKWLKTISWIVGISVGIVSLVMAGLSAYSYYNVNRLISESYNLEKIDLSREIDKLNTRIQQLEENS